MAGNQTRWRERDPIQVPQVLETGGQRTRHHLECRSEQGSRTAQQPGDEGPEVGRGRQHGDDGSEQQWRRGRSFREVN